MSDTPMTETGAAATATADGEPLIEVTNLVKHFPVTQGILLRRQIGAVKAVDDVSFKIYPGPHALAAL